MGSSTEGIGFFLFGSNSKTLFFDPFGIDASTHKNRGYCSFLASTPGCCYRGRDGLSPTPPSEPDVQFSRIRLSS